MKLWLLKPRQKWWDTIAEDTVKEESPWYPWFDCNFGFVIRAEDETTARAIAQTNAADECKNERHQKTILAWADEKYSTCEELLPKGEVKVILREPHWA